MSIEQAVLLISGLSTLTLAILTGIYVYLTGKLVKASNEATRQQVRALTAPYLRCYVYQSKKPRFKLSNVGNGPAYDIDLLVLGHYAEVELGSLLTKKDSKGNSITFEPDEEGIFNIFDRIVYGYAFPKSEVDAPFAFPKHPGSLSILLQYRDISGDNFAQLLWFFENFSGHKRYYKLGACDPEVIQVSPRIEFESTPFKLVIKESKKLPKAFQKARGYRDFERAFCFAVSSSHFVPDFEIEDRGEWKSM
jgi:hypothetical protein